MASYVIRWEDVELFSIPENESLQTVEDLVNECRERVKGLVESLTAMMGEPNAILFRLVQEEFCLLCEDIKLHKDDKLYVGTFKPSYSSREFPFKPSTKISGAYELVLDLATLPLAADHPSNSEVNQKVDLGFLPIRLVAKGLDPHIIPLAKFHLTRTIRSNPAHFGWGGFSITAPMSNEAMAFHDAALGTGNVTNPPTAEGRFPFTASISPSPVTAAISPFATSPSALSSTIASPEAGAEQRSSQQQMSSQQMVHSNMPAGGMHRGLPSTLPPSMPVSPVAGGYTHEYSPVHGVIPHPVIFGGIPQGLGMHGSSVSIPQQQGSMQNQITSAHNLISQSPQQSGSLMGSPNQSFSNYSPVARSPQAGLSGTQKNMSQQTASPSERLLSQSPSERLAQQTAGLRRMLPGECDSVTSPLELGHPGQAQSQTNSSPPAGGRQSRVLIDDLADDDFVGSLKLNSKKGSTTSEKLGGLGGLKSMLQQMGSTIFGRNSGSWSPVQQPKAQPRLPNAQTQAPNPPPAANHSIQDKITYLQSTMQNINMQNSLRNSVQNTMKDDYVNQNDNGDSNNVMQDKLQCTMQDSLQMQMQQIQNMQSQLQGMQNRDFENSLNSLKSTEKNNLNSVPGIEKMDPIDRNKFETAMKNMENAMKSLAFAEAQMQKPIALGEAQLAPATQNQVGMQKGRPKGRPAFNAAAHMKGPPAHIPMQMSSMRNTMPPLPPASTSLGPAASSTSEAGKGNIPNSNIRSNSGINSSITSSNVVDNVNDKPENPSNFSAKAIAIQKTHPHLDILALMRAIDVSAGTHYREELFENEMMGLDEQLLSLQQPNIANNTLTGNQNQCGDQIEADDRNRALHREFGEIFQCYSAMEFPDSDIQSIMGWLSNQIVDFRSDLYSNSIIDSTDTNSNRGDSVAKLNKLAKQNNLEEVQKFLAKQNTNGVPVKASNGNDVGTSNYTNTANTFARNNNPNLTREELLATSGVNVKLDVNGNMIEDRGQIDASDAKIQKKTAIPTSSNSKTASRGGPTLLEVLESQKRQFTAASKVLELFINGENLESHLEMIEDNLFLLQKAQTDINLFIEELDLAIQNGGEMFTFENYTGDINQMFTFENHTGGRNLDQNRNPVAQSPSNQTVNNQENDQFVNDPLVNEQLFRTNGTNLKDGYDNPVLESTVNQLLGGMNDQSDSKHLLEAMEQQLRNAGISPIGMNRVDPPVGISKGMQNYFEMSKRYRQQQQSDGSSVTGNAGINIAGSIPGGNTAGASNVPGGITANRNDVANPKDAGMIGDRSTGKTSLVQNSKNELTTNYEWEIVEYCGDNSMLHPDDSYITHGAYNANANTNAHAHSNTMHSLSGLGYIGDQNVPAAHLQNLHVYNTDTNKLTSNLTSHPSLIIGPNASTAISSNAGAGMKSVSSSIARVAPRQCRFSEVNSTIAVGNTATATNSPTTTGAVCKSSGNVANSLAAGVSSADAGAFVPVSGTNNAVKLKKTSILPPTENLNDLLSIRNVAISVIPPDQNKDVLSGSGGASNAATKGTVTVVGTINSTTASANDDEAKKLNLVNGKFAPSITETANANLAAKTVPKASTGVAGKTLPQVITGVAASTGVVVPGATAGVSGVSEAAAGEAQTSSLPQVGGSKQGVRASSKVVSGKGVQPYQLIGYSLNYPGLMYPPPAVVTGSSSTATGGSTESSSTTTVGTTESSSTTTVGTSSVNGSTTGVPGATSPSSPKPAAATPSTASVAPLITPSQAANPTDASQTTNNTGTPITTLKPLINRPDQYVEIHNECQASWTLYAIKQKVASYGRGTRLYSPPFSVFGIRNVRLVFYPSGNSESRPGFCSLGLKVPGGVHLRYRLFIGGTGRLTELRHTVRESWGFVDMCSIATEIVDLSHVGTITTNNVGSTTTTIGNTIGVTTTTINTIVGNATNATINRTVGNATTAGNTTIVVDSNGANNASDTTIASSDILLSSNELITTSPELIKSACDAYFSDKLVLGVEIIDDIDTHERMSNVQLPSAGGDSTTIVNKGESSSLNDNNTIEWRIYNFHSKLKHYKKDIPMYSPSFSLCGTDDIRLKFYPQGKKEAEPGFCSLYLEAPRNSELRCRFFVGRKHLSFDRLEKFVDDSIWGFLSVCKVAEEVLMDDSFDIDYYNTKKATEAEANRNEEKVRIISIVEEENNENIKNENKEECKTKDETTTVKTKDDAILTKDDDGILIKKLDDTKLPPEVDHDWIRRCFPAEQRRSYLKITLEILETKKLDSRLNDNEDSFLKSVDCQKRIHLLKEFQRIDLLLRQRDQTDIPSRFRILLLDLPDSGKQIALQKWESLQNDALSGEAQKTKRWLDGVLQVPFGRYAPAPLEIDWNDSYINKDDIQDDERPLSITRDLNPLKKKEIRDYLSHTKKVLDQAVFGHAEPKERILQLICQWISNPKSQSLNLGIQGPPGNGKTTLCRQGIAKALGRPFAQISLGGATDAAVLEGHSFTYVGSSWGRMISILMESRVMNPVVLFDELDKVSETQRGDEIIGVLTHLTDHSQNTHFADRYFDGIPIDLSRAMFIFSFNDESKINPILKDRLTILKTKGFSMPDKLKITQQHLLPTLLSNVGMSKGDIVVESLEQLQFICRRWHVSESEGGVRRLKQALESIVLNVNKIWLLQNDEEEVEKQQSDERQEKIKNTNGGEKEKEVSSSKSSGTSRAEAEGESRSQIDSGKGLIKQWEIETQKASGENKGENKEKASGESKGENKEKATSGGKTANEKKPTLEALVVEPSSFECENSRISREVLEQVYLNLIDALQDALKSEKDSSSASKSKLSVIDHQGESCDTKKGEKISEFTTSSMTKAENQKKEKRIVLPLVLTEKMVTWLLPPKEDDTTERYKMMFI